MDRRDGWASHHTAFRAVVGSRAHRTGIAVDMGTVSAAVGSHALETLRVIHIANAGSPARHKVCWAGSRRSVGHREALDYTCLGLDLVRPFARAWILCLLIACDCREVRCCLDRDFQAWPSVANENADCEALDTVLESERANVCLEIRGDMDPRLGPAGRGPTQNDGCAEAAESGSTHASPHAWVNGGDVDDGSPPLFSDERAGMLLSLLLQSHYHDQTLSIVIDAVGADENLEVDGERPLCRPQA